jgi:hypothetical protein
MWSDRQPQQLRKAKIVYNYLLVNVIIRSQQKNIFWFRYYSHSTKVFVLKTDRAVGKTKFIQRRNHYKIFVDRLNVGNVAYLTTDRSFN